MRGDGGIERARRAQARDDAFDARMWSRQEVLTTPCVPRRPGVYAYFRDVPPSVPIDGCVVGEGLTLLYGGVAPKTPPTNGRQSADAVAPSPVSLRRQRLRIDAATDVGVLARGRGSSHVSDRVIAVPCRPVLSRS